MIKILIKTILIKFLLNDCCWIATAFEKDISKIASAFVIVEMEIPQGKSEFDLWLEKIKSTFRYTKCAYIFPGNRLLCNCYLLTTIRLDDTPSAVVNLTI